MDSVVDRFMPQTVQQADADDWTMLLFKADPVPPMPTPQLTPAPEPELTPAPKMEPAPELTPAPTPEPTPAPKPELTPPTKPRRLNAFLHEPMLLLQEEEEEEAEEEKADVVLDDRGCVWEDPEDRAWCRTMMRATRCEICDRPTEARTCERCGLTICQRCLECGGECMCPYMEEPTASEPANPLRMERNSQDTQ